MLESLTGQNAIYLMLGVAGLWFMARFVIAPRRGAPGLSALFGRETAAPVIGLGKEAIASLLDDTRTFIVRELHLRGLVLAGPFVTKSADSDSTVTLIALADDIGPYASADWLTRWPYSTRGHHVIEHRIEPETLGVTHYLTLRGAPPVAFRVEKFPSIHFPAAIGPALAIGCETLEDPTGQVEKLRRAWLDQVRREEA
jgi:hypothetical protein